MKGSITSTKDESMRHNEQVPRFSSLFFFEHKDFEHNRAGEESYPGS